MPTTSTAVARSWRTITAAASISAVSAFAAATTALAQDDTTLRVRLESDVRILDPIATTATTTAIHAMMVFDTLFGLDESLNPQPQMVDSYTISEDRLTYTFTLRDGLQWHDGEPVTAEDCVASLQRWGARDGAGQIMFDSVETLRAIDDKTFEIVLSEPFGPLIDLLAKSGPNVAFMMPKRLAESDPEEQITEMVGSGPFLFEEDEWVPGNRLVYSRNPDYVPRDEPANGTGGGKRVLVDRVELLSIPDQQTAFAALTAGEIDFLSAPAPDFVPLLRDDPNVALGQRGSVGSQGMMRLNWLQPPFDNRDARLAMLRLIDQSSIMDSLGLGEFAEECWAVFACGGPLESDVSVPTRDVEAAQALFESAGYSGEQLVVLHATDNPALDPATLVVVQQLRDAGIAVDMQSMDWGTLTQRRANRGPVSDGGWNIFLTSLSGPPITNPLTHPSITASCDDAWFGWPCDAEIEELRTAWPSADAEESRQIAERIQERVYSEGIYVPYGQWISPFAYRDDRLDGVLQVPNLLVFWNIAKNAE